MFNSLLTLYVYLDDDTNVMHDDARERRYCAIIINTFNTTTR